MYTRGTINEYYLSVPLIKAKDKNIYFRNSKSYNYHRAGIIIDSPIA